MGGQHAISKFLSGVKILRGLSRSKADVTELFLKDHLETDVFLFILLCKEVHGCRSKVHLICEVAKIKLNGGRATTIESRECSRGISFEVGSMGSSVWHEVTLRW